MLLLFSFIWWNQNSNYVYSFHCLNYQCWDTQCLFALQSTSQLMKIFIFHNVADSNKEESKHKTLPANLWNMWLPFFPKPCKQYRQLCKKECCKTDFKLSYNFLNQLKYGFKPSFFVLKVKLRNSNENKLSIRFPI